MVGYIYLPRYCPRRRVLNSYYISLEFIYCSLIIQIFRYLSGTLDLGITFTANLKDKLVGYINSNYAGLLDSKKSIDGEIFILSSGSLSYHSKLQSTIALSLCKAKYMVTMEVVRKAL